MHRSVADLELALATTRARCPARSRVLPADPGRPGASVLALPDRDARLYFVDEEPARAERLVPVRRAGRAHHGDVADLEPSDSMQNGEAHAGHFCVDLGADAIHLLF